MKKKGLLLEISLLFLGIVCIIVTVFTANMLRGLGGDNASQTYALFLDVSRALNSDAISLWNPYLWGGFSNVGHFITEAYYPINWLLCNIFYDAETTLVSYAIIPWNLVIHYCIYFIGMFYLIKKLKFSNLNAFIIGISSVFCCSMFYFRTWVVYTDGLCWIPLVILFSIRMFEERGRRKSVYAIVLGLIFTMEALISISIMLVFSAIVFFAIFLLYTFKKRRTEVISNIVNSAIAGGTAILLSAPLLLTTMTFMNNMSRFVPNIGHVTGNVKIPYEEFSHLKYTFSEFIQMLQFSESDMGLSIGAIVIIFGTVGVFCKNVNNKRIFLFAVVGSTISLCYSFSLIFPRIAYYVPGLNNIREPFLYSILFGMFGSIVAAYGFNAVEKWILEKKRLKELFIFPSIVAVIMTAVILVNLLNYTMINVLICIIVLIIVVMSVFKQNKLLFYTTIFLIMIMSYTNFYSTIDTGMYSEKTAIARVDEVNLNIKSLIKDINAIDKYDNYFRLTQWGSECYPENMATTIGFYDVQGYLNPTVTRAVDMHLFVGLEKRSQLQNIKYFLVNTNASKDFLEWFPAAYPGLELNDTKDGIISTYDAVETSEIQIYKSNYNIGDAWLVNRMEWYDSESSAEEIATKINREEFQVDKVALINRDKLNENDLKEVKNLDGNQIVQEVSCSVESNNRLTYDVSSSADAILVTAELYYPGWKVYVNGKKKTLLEIDYYNRGVMVPAGTSKVEFVYIPVEYYIGLAMQFIGSLIILIFMLIYRKKRI